MWSMKLPLFGMNILIFFILRKNEFAENTAHMHELNNRNMTLRDRVME
jgi:hypothetical protein